VLVLGLGALLLVAWSSRAERAVLGGAVSISAVSNGATSNPGCTCELERQRNGWCAACSVGYVADTAIHSKILYDALDAHGHDVDVASLPCASCREAARTDGFCTEHGRGFVHGQAYLSRLSYHLARGEREAVQEELATLALALDKVATCELCAAAMVLDGTCPKCLIAYEHGRARPLR
jgi:hypothetical protein